MDIFEGNTRAIRVSPHCCCSESCTGTTGELCLDSASPPYTVCDRSGRSAGYGGNPIFTFDDPANSLGPGTSFSINTQKTFHVDVQFPVDANGRLHSIVTSLSQSETAFNLTLNLPVYLTKFTAPLQAGMAMVFSLWESSNMTWLDGGVSGCKSPERCGLPFRKPVTFSNLKITPLHPLITLKGCNDLF